MNRTNLLSLLSLGLALGFVNSAAQAAEGKGGKAAFERVCMQCHGDKAAGGEGPPLVPMVYDESQVLAIVRAGQGKMPALTEELVKDQEITEIIAYLGALE